VREILTHVVRLSPEDRARLVARLLDEDRPGADRAGAPAPVTPRRADPPPASFLQEQLLFFDRLDPGLPTYNIPFAFRLCGALNYAALAGALTQITERHEILRSVVDFRAGRAVQLIGPPAPVTLPVVDLSAIPRAHREERALALARREARRGFDISAGPLLRHTLYRLDAEDHVLTWVAHHAVADGESLGLVLRELAGIYGPSCRGEAAGLADPVLQYGDFAAWQRENPGPARRAELLRFWAARADALPDLRLPTRAARPPVQTFDGAHVPFTVPGLLAGSLRQLARQTGTTLFMVLMAAYQVVLARWSGQHEFAIGTSVTGRLGSEVETLIGPFANTVFVRADLAADPDGREILGRVREAALDALAHQDLPFGQLVSGVGGSRDPSRNPFFQVMLELGAAAAAGREIRLGEGLTLTATGIQHGAAPVDVLLAAEDTGEALACRVDYNTDLFDEVMISRAVQDFLTVLDCLGRQPGLRLSQLPPVPYPAGPWPGPP
jgi:Condensation domain